MSGQYRKAKKHIFFRLIAFAAALLTMFIAPLLTQAQYKWTLNGFQTVRAGEFYFDSNYLSNPTKRYTVNGWDGKQKTVTIDIRNFENAILCNGKGQDVTYDLTARISTRDASGNVLSGDSEYTYTFKRQYFNSTTEKTEETMSSKNYLISGSYYGQEVTHSSAKLTGDGSPNKYSYTLTFAPDSNLSNRLTTGGYVRIVVTASSGTTNEYRKSMSAIIDYVVTDEDAFLSMDVEDADESLSVNMETSAVAGTGVSTRMVVIWYDPERLSLDTFMDVYTEAYAKGWIGEMTVDSIPYTYLVFDIGSQAQREFYFTKKGNTYGSNVTADGKIPKGYIGLSQTAIGYYIMSTDDGSAYRQDSSSSHLKKAGDD